MRFYLILLTLIFSQAQAESVCYGSTSDGRLENGERLPSGGSNYRGYSALARLFGRTYVHSSVKDIVVKAYARLETDQPDKVYKYAESGLKEGGEFEPHKTHKNGLSVDFMTPVMDSDGSSVHLPTNMFNKLGYNIEIDEFGNYEELSIDYEAMAAHIVALHKESQLAGNDLWRVIFAPELQPPLFETRYGPYLEENIEFSTERSWVRHDEHYHVDFAVPCD